MRSAGLSLAIALIAGSAFAEPRWATLPPAPALPKATRSGHVSVGGVKIWWAEFGRGAPVMLLHGGAGTANFWGNQVPALAKRHRVVIVESRGHGRSTRDDAPFSYEVMADDVVAVMRHLKIEKAALVGLSDGAIVALEMAIHHPDRVGRVFAFGANSDPSAVMEKGFESPTFASYVAWAEKQYAALSSTPTEFQTFVEALKKMWATQPKITREQLNGIRVPVWIVDGDRDEVIKRENTEWMAAEIPGAGLLVQPEVSHFAPLQDPELFNRDVLHFLEHAGGGR